MKNVYVFYGEEKLLIEQEIDNLIKTVLGDDERDNLSKYDMSQATIRYVLEDACTASLFSGMKVIICSNSIFLTSVSQSSEVNGEVEELTKYLKNSNDRAIIIFTVNQDKLDSRKKIVKVLKENAIVKEFNKMKDADLISYAKKMFKENNYSIDNRATELLVSRIEQNLSLLCQEINKLMIYKLEEKNIDYKDVEEMVPVSVFENIFDLTKAVVDKDLEKILGIYERLLAKNEEPIKIIITLANQFRLIYQTKRLKELGYSEYEIATKLEVHSYPVKLAGQVNLNQKTLLTYLDRLADLDIGIKTGKINKASGLELFFLQL